MESDPTSLRSAPAELAGQVAVAEAVTKHGAQPFEEIAGMLENAIPARLNCVHWILPAGGTHGPLIGIL